MALKVTKTIPTVATVVTTPIVARWGLTAPVPVVLTPPIDDMPKRQALDAHGVPTSLHQFYDRYGADNFIAGQWDPAAAFEYDTEVYGDE
jgi:hypothetical protein